MNIGEELLIGGVTDAPALLEAGRVITYGSLRERAQAVSGWAARERLPQGSRIGILAENGAFFVAAYLGIIRAGMVAVPLNTDSSMESLRRVLQIADAAALLISKRQAARCEREKAAPHGRMVGEETLNPCDGGPAVEVSSRTDLAALMFTSGSTGEPKGVRVTHRNIECNTRDIVAYLGLTSADRALLVLPLHYCFGLSVLHSHLMAGATVVFNNQFLYPETVLRDIAQLECTGFAGVPSTYQILLRKSRLKSANLPSLRWLQQAGGRLPNAHIEELRQALPHVRLFTMYGQTEATSRLSYLPPERLHDKLGYIGTGLPSTRLEVLRPDGARVRPGSDEVGEIVAAGDNICDGYWNDAEETAKYFREGRLFTGDLARVDAEGFIQIVDRDRDMIKSAGNRVSPKEIEDVIARHSDVVEVAVVGLPDELLGEAIVAAVVATPGAQVEAEELRTLCRRELAPYKIPVRIELVPALPHNSSGKILKRELRNSLSRT